MVHMVVFVEEDKGCLVLRGLAGIHAVAVGEVQQGLQIVQLLVPPQLLRVPEYRREVRAAPALDGDAPAAVQPLRAERMTVTLCTRQSHWMRYTFISRKKFSWALTMA